HIRLRKISCGTTSRNAVRNNHEVSRHSLLALEVADQIHARALLQTCRANIRGIQKNDAPPVVNAAITIVQSVDRGVELVMTADRHHQILVGLQLMMRQIMDSKNCATAWRVENALARRARKMKAAGLSHAQVVVVKARHNSLDMIPDQIVIGNERLPIDSRASP